MEKILLELNNIEGSIDNIKIIKELNINKSLLNALNDLGLESPTTIQENVFSVVMSGKDVCGIAQTGTGKTLAYLLPLLRLWTFSKEKLPEILVLVPTRELVIQVVEMAKELTKYISFDVIGVYGGVNLKLHVSELSKGCDILVATPGRFIDLASSGALKVKNIKQNLQVILLILKLFHYLKKILKNQNNTLI
jgi:ATP-dependent RNA helicase RhlE